MNKLTSSKTLRILLPVLAVLPGLALVLYYIIGPAVGHMTSDCTDSLRWAEASYKSGRLISDDFKYAALLPFGGNLLFLPFIALFGFSVRAQICGLVVFALLFAFSLYYLARGLELSRTASAGFVSIVLLTLSASGKLREIMWEHVFYYNLGLLFFCFGFGLALRLIRSKAFSSDSKREKRLFVIRLILLCLFSVIAATDGLQTLVCFTMPLVFGLVAERFFAPETNLKTPGNAFTFLLAGVVVLFSLIGFILIVPLSHGVTAGYAEAYSAYSAMGSWKDNFLNFFHNWLTLFGVSVKDGDTLVSLASVGTMIRIFVGYFLLFFPLSQLFRGSRIENRSVRILLLGNCAVFLFIVFAVTFGRLGSANWRLVPLLGTSLISTYMVTADLLRQKGAPLRCGAAVLIFLVLMAFLPALEISRMPADYGRDQVIFVTAKKLQEKGLKFGYATFWWSEILSMVSDGQVEVANLVSDKEKPEAYPYQQYYDAYQKQDNVDRYFILLSEKENRTMQNWLKEQESAGRISERFVINTPYSFYGGSGNQVFVYVFPDSIF